MWHSVWLPHQNKHVLEWIEIMEAPFSLEPVLQ